MKDITPADLRQRLATDDRPFLLDVRQPEEFAAGKIDGAVLIPLGELPARLAELPGPATEIVVNCHSGGRSAKACQFLESQGYRDVANLTGGFLRWRAES